MIRIEDFGISKKILFNISNLCYSNFRKQERKVIYNMLKKVRIVVLIIVIIVTANIPVLVGAKSSEKAKQDFANVVFFAYFRGDTEGKEYLINNYQDFVKMYEGEGNLSVKGYLNKVSYGKFNLINIFPQYDGKQLVPIELPLY